MNKWKWGVRIKRLVIFVTSSSTMLVWLFAVCRSRMGLHVSVPALNFGKTATALATGESPFHVSNASRNG